MTDHVLDVVERLWHDGVWEGDEGEDEDEYTVEAHNTKDFCWWGMRQYSSAPQVDSRARLGVHHLLPWSRTGNDLTINELSYS